MQKVQNLSIRLAASVRSIATCAMVCGIAATTATEAFAAARPLGRAYAERFPAAEVVKLASEHQVLAYGTVPLAAFAVMIAAVMGARMVLSLAQRSDLGMAMRADRSER